MSNIQNVASQQLAGCLGVVKSKLVTGTSLTTPDVGSKFLKLTVITAATFSAIDGNVDNLTGVAIPVGVEIYGRLNSFTLTSGSVIAYEGS